MGQRQLHRADAPLSRTSSRLLWAIVVVATVMTFVIGQVLDAA